MFFTCITWNVNCIIWDVKHHGTTTFMFDSRSAWNVIYIARSNLWLWDAKCTGTTTFMFDSRNTWNVLYIAGDNLWDAKRNGTTTFVFDSRSTLTVIYIARGHLRDAKRNGTTTFMFDSRNTWNVIYITRGNLWDAKRNGTTTFMFDSRNTWNVIYIARSNRSHPPTPNIARQTWSVQSVTLMIDPRHTWYVQRGATGATLQCRTKLLQFPKRTSSSWGVPYRLSVFGNPSYWCTFRNSRTLSNWPGNAAFLLKWFGVEQSFWCGKGGDEEEELFALSSWLHVVILLASIRCLCWALLLRLSNGVCLFLQFLVECLHHRLAACIFDLSLREDCKLEHLVGEWEPLPRVHPMVRDLYPNLHGLHRSILSYMVCRCLWLVRLTKRMWDQQRQGASWTHNDCTHELR